MGLSYLVSTAGHAQFQNESSPHDIRTIVQLIEDGSREFEDEKVVGFTSLGDAGEWSCDRFSFLELLRISDGQIAQLSANGVNVPENGKSGVISMLFPTGLDFLVTWIALMRMGYGVVFIAPQCSPSAIKHLLSSSSSTRLIYHPKYADLALAAKGLGVSVPLLQVPPCEDYERTATTFNGRTIDPDSVSHVFHTSGTSGTPKPIPNTHSQSVSVLPRRCLPSYISPCSEAPNALPSESAAFTTTPLFHGGVSDLLRAWMARSMIYFYPTSDTPVTSQNVVAAVKACQISPAPLANHSLTDDQRTERVARFKVTSFLSVPYILTILSENPDGPGMAMLRGMSLVSTGGAPLDTRVGDAMVDNGIRLVSRLGSSECGFLLSSHRDYVKEKDWEWLRNDSPYSNALVFEPIDATGPVDADRFEMIVTNRWSSKTKSNRDDGSYATGDLYEPHSTKQNLWRYAGRGDDVIVLSNGEKASPGSIETVLRSSPYLVDALVVGSDRSQLGVLLFSRDHSDAETIVEAVASLLEQANQASPTYAHVARDMCLVIDLARSSKELPKSSKGTVQRGVAYQVFKEEIEQLYASVLVQQTSIPKRSLTEVQDLLLDMIKKVAGPRRASDPLDLAKDLFSWGVDSLMATRIRSAILNSFNIANKPLPLNVVFEKPSVERLSRYIVDLQDGNDTDSDDVETPYHLMETLADRYSRASWSSTAPSQVTSALRDRVVVITGGTGSLGSFLVDQFARLPSSVVSKIVCLVRAEDDRAALRRIKSSLKQRGLEWNVDRVEAYAADFSKPHLGLTPQVYAKLRDELGSIVHAAWPVHFASSLISFEDSIKGTRNLLDLLNDAKSRSAKFYYCSSLASVLGQTPSDGVVHEQISDDPRTASQVGYAQSKWVAERICLAARNSVNLQDRTHILRIGQLCGDTVQGRWNEKEGWPLMIRTAQITGCLPVLQEKPSWLPVDLAARAVVDIVTTEVASQSPFIFHVVHPSHLDWDQILGGLESAGLEFEKVSPDLWLDKVEASSDDPERNPSKQMLSMWRAAYGRQSTDREESIISADNALAASATLRHIEPISAVHIGKMVQAWRRTGYLT